MSLSFIQTLENEKKNNYSKVPHYSIVIISNSEIIEIYPRDERVNPQTPKVFRKPKKPEGLPSPWIFAFPFEFFENFSRFWGFRA